MNLHGQIMNLQIVQDGRSIAREAVTDSGGIHIAYKLGHRDARHQAAELAIQADTMMDDMATSLEELLCAMRLAGWDDDAIAKNAKKALCVYKDFCGKIMNEKENVNEETE